MQVSDANGRKALRRYAVANGWMRSRAEMKPVDSEGNPLPWYTYPAIHFLEERAKPEWTVFEFGCGHSTLWWARRVQEVFSVEHNHDWADMMAAKAPANARIRFVELLPGGDYCRAAQMIDRKFDVIVIDGEDRIRCMNNSLDKLAPGGVFVWDNAERGGLEAAFSRLARRGFKRLRLVGHGPMLGRTGDTSIFYKRRNCMGI